jgi:hypothetical protein
MAFVISATFPLKSFRLSSTNLEKNQISYPTRQTGRGDGGPQVILFEFVHKDKGFGDYLLVFSWLSKIFLKNDFFLKKGAGFSILGCLII